MAWRTKPEKRGAKEDQFENILGRTSLCRGDLTSDGAYRIDGWVEGSVESGSAVVIGESGAVRGKPDVRPLVVSSNKSSPAMNFAPTRPPASNAVQKPRNGPKENAKKIRSPRVTPAAR